MRLRQHLFAPDRLRSDAAMTAKLPWLTAQVIWLATLSLALSAFVFGPWLLSIGVLATVALAGLAVVIVGAAAAFMRRGRVGLPSWAEQPGTWAMIVVAGIVARLAWCALFPATLSSDPQAYYEAAIQLLQEGRYYNTADIVGLDGQSTGVRVELLALRAPGLSFLLAGWFAVFGIGTWAIVGLNLVIYVSSALVLALAARRLIGPSSVAPVLLIFAVWPKHIVYTGLPLTEGLSLLLLTLCVLLFDLALAGSRRSLAGAGLAYGTAALVRPSLVLLPAVWAGMAWVASGSRVRQMLSVVVAALIGLAVIAPWTARNLRVLGHPVLISTNGGDVLYRANNPLATGNWSPAGERNLDAFIQDEVRWNETGSAWAWEWIRSNPIGFAKLAIRKLGFLWGWEEEGIIFHMHYPEIAAANRAFSITADVIMNGWWFALLCAVAASLMHQRAALTRSSFAIGLALSVLLLTTVHMLYESHARYHFPFVGALILLACTGPFLAAPAGAEYVKRGRQQDLPTRLGQQ